MSLPDAPPPSRRGGRGGDRPTAPSGEPISHPPTQTSPIPAQQASPGPSQQIPAEQPIIPTPAPPAPTPAAAPAQELASEFEAMLRTPAPPTPNPIPDYDSGSFTDFEGDSNHAPQTEPEPSPKTRKKGGFRSPRKEKLTPTDSVKARNTKRRVVIGAIMVGTAALVGNFVVGVVSPPPSADEVAASVTDSIFSDEQYSPFVSTGAQFLEAYLMPATTREEEDARLEQLNLLTAGLGSSWVSGEVVPAKAVRIVRGPYLNGEPVRVSPALVPRAVTLPFQVWVEDSQGVIERAEFSVTVASSRNPDTGAFTVYVPVPPSLVSVDPVEAQDAPEVESDKAVSGAATPQLQQFLKIWAAFNADEATEAQKTNLMSFLSTGISKSAVAGLSGKVTFESLDSVDLIPDNPEAPSSAEGLIVVTWRNTTSGVLYSASYQVAMVKEANRWLVQSITPLGG